MSVVQSFDSSLRKYGALGYFIIGGFVFAVLLGLFAFGMEQAFKPLIEIDPNAMAGSVNLSENAETTISPVINGLVTHIDFIVYMGLFGHIIGIIIISWLLRSNVYAMVIVDVFFLLIAFFVSTYVSHGYSLILENADVGAKLYTDFLKNRLANTSQFLLNLPIYVMITGLISIVISYAFASRKASKGLNLAGAGAFTGGGSSLAGDRFDGEDMLNSDFGGEIDEKSLR